jgi:phage terminase large subunit-like protein
MVRNDPALLKECYLVDSQKRIEHWASGSIYRAIAAEAHSKHGFNASMVIYDELHAAPDRRLYDVLSTSMGARSQPLLLVISTAGYDRHSILWELYQHAKKVQENPRLDPTFLPVLYEAGPDDDWTSEATWRKCNPALGDFRSLKDMRILCDRAKEIPAQENNFRRLYLNQWTEQASRWIPMAAWEACRQPVDRAALRGRRCYVGMDLSATTDLTALVAVFPDAEGFDVLAQCFVPAERIRERARRDKVPYDQWAREGWLPPMPGPTVDYEVVRQALRAWCAEFDVQMVAFDPWNATDLVSRLEKQDGLVCVPMRQGFGALSAPTKSLEKAILARQLRHDGHPVLRWCVSNVAVESDPAGNLKPSKVVSTERIDAVVALIMAVDLMDRNARTPALEYGLSVIG